jgi:RHH-type proline utilization regulon transcriptional repressor/proline dehydrogenase/delta 1-pyrroline-5-carboxylate dehydrogenase
MLGEGARNAADAAKYFDAYSGAIAAIGASRGNAASPARPGISVKLSALHPRYEAISRERVLKELVPRLIELARLAKAHELAFTVDAEEADRLELSLDVIGAVLRDSSLRGWDGFGLAVQAYQKRALPVIAWVEEAAVAAGSLLGHRDQAGAGTRAPRLSGVHPQGDDRPLLHGVREEALGCARALVSAIRHP